MGKDELLKSFEPMIHKLSCSYFYKLPSCSYYELEDLEQECRIELNEALKKFDKSKGKFFQFCYQRVNWMLCNLLIAECRAKRHFDALELSRVGLLTGNDSPEKNIMMSEFLIKCSEVNPDFVDMIVNGATLDLLLAERRARRSSLRKRKGKRESALNTPLKFSKALIENFFNLKVEKIQLLFYNTIE